MKKLVAKVMLILDMTQISGNNNCKIWLKNC